MIVKPAIQFLNTDSDYRLIADTAAIFSAMTGNASFPSPTPSLAAVAEALRTFSTALADAADGGKAMTAAKNAARAMLVRLMRQLASCVQVACQDDLNVLLSSGFPVQKPTRQPVGALLPPANLTVTLGAGSGELEANAAPVKGASIYNWRVTAAAQPGMVVQTAQTTAASNRFSNLTPGVVYKIEANVVGAAGPSDWSRSVSQMAV